MSACETILAVLPGATEHQRLVISIPTSSTRFGQRLKVCRPDAEQNAADDSADSISAVSSPQAEEPCVSTETSIFLRQESFSDAVGWFTQSCVELTAEQWEAMRSALAVTTGMTVGSRPNKRVGCTPGSQRTAISRLTAADEEPAVISFAAASAEQADDCAVSA